MPRFAANVSMLYNEHVFLDRFEAAARDGFKAVEYLFPYDFDARELRRRLDDNGLQHVLFNAPPGDWLLGERGLACLPDREQEFRDGVSRALEYAHALGCPRIHVMAGLREPGVDPAWLSETYVSNAAWAADRAADAGCDVLIEPINTRDMPGYFLTHQAQAHDIVLAVGAPNLKVQLDLYHCQIMEGDLETRLRQYLPSGRVGHLQIAGVPKRHEPNSGEVNYAHLLGVIDELSATSGWDGWVGCEYRPARGAVAGGTTDGLGWMQACSNRQPGGLGS